MGSPSRTVSRITEKRFRAVLTGRRALFGPLAAGRVLAVAAKLDFVARLLAVIAAVLSVKAVRLHHTLTHRVRAFRFDVGHEAPLSPALYYTCDHGRCVFSIWGRTDWPAVPWTCLGYGGSQGCPSVGCYPSNRHWVEALYYLLDYT